MNRLLALALLGACAASPLVVGKTQEGGPESPDGKTAVTCDLPAELRQKNVGGLDGAGCCPFASTQHQARWQNETRLWNFLDDVAKHEQGGGWPEKMDKMIAKYGKGTPYLQYSGPDPAVLDLAIKTGRMPSVTYNGHDVHYGTGTNIAHMVSLIALTQDQACILDNNYVGDGQYLWMTRDDFLQRWKGNGGGWCVILLKGRPPACPHN